MLKRAFSAVVLVLLLTSIFALASSIQQVKARTIIVPDDYLTIQEAINAASPGDTIFVKAGTYYENVVLDKSVSLIGEDKTTTVIDAEYTVGDPILYAIDISANDVTVSGFTIQNAYRGIYMRGSSRSCISGNIIKNVDFGVIVFGAEYGDENGTQFGPSEYVTIEGNIIAHAPYGIEADDSDMLVIKNNAITNGAYGIIIYGFCNHIQIIKNNIADIRALGRCIDIVVSDDATIVENTLSRSDCGMFIYGVEDVEYTIYHNNFIDNVKQVELLYNPSIVWDDGYPSGGNYWTDYTGVDANRDDIGDTSYTIDANNRDRYPLMRAWTPAPLWPSPVYGKGIWIWRLSEAEGGDLSAIIERLKSANVDWVAVKCAEGSGTIASDGYDYASQWTSSIINQIKSAGIRFLGWQYVYGDDPIGEANVANRILDAGVDGFIIDAEGEYEGKPVSAVTYMDCIRSAHSDSFIAYAPFPIIDYHTAFPYIEFGKYCDVVMPQVYWKEICVTPEEMVSWMEEQWNKWNKIWIGSGYADSVKPVVAIGQGYAVAGSEITRFCDLIYDHKYCGLSLWRYDTMTEEDWEAYANCFNPQISVTGLCPVDLLIMDPDSLITSKLLNEILGASYNEFDANGDGSVDKEATILHRKTGDYFITVIAQPNALPNDTYTLKVSAGNTSLILAENVSVSDIPSQPYIVTSNETTIIPRLDPHDIGIRQLITSKTVVGQGFSLPVNVTIFNYGNFTEAFNVTFYANATFITTLSNITVASRNTVDIDFAWITIGFAKGNYTINAFAEPVLGENYTEDNMLGSDQVIVTIPGDLNGDKIVDIYDAIILANHFEFDRYHPSWDSNVDINNDEIIDIYDAILLAANYGESWT